MMMMMMMTSIGNCFVFLLVFAHLFVGCLLVHECSYLHETKCPQDANSEVAKELCSIDDIPMDPSYTIILDEKKSSSWGDLEVDFPVMNSSCRLKIALMVNSTIGNSHECESHVFQTTSSGSSELHTVDKIVCFVPGKGNRSAPDCSERVTMRFEHVFTGCYGLRFTLDDHRFVIRGKTFLSTSYTRKEVSEPKFHCDYVTLERSECNDMVAVSADIRVLRDSTFLHLELAPVSQSNRDKEMSCIRYSESPIFSLDVNVGDMETRVPNCSFAVDEKRLDGYTHHAECNFEVLGSRNSSYCFLIHVKDDRCHRNGIWNPPPHNSIPNRVPCSWVQRCLAKTARSNAVVEYRSDIQRDILESNHGYYVYVLLLLSLLSGSLVLGSVFLLYRFYRRKAVWESHRRRHHVCLCDNATMDQFRSLDTTSRTTTSEDVVQDEKIELRSWATREVVLLYVKGDPAFMSCMEELRRLLQRICSCSVHDWFAAEEWDEVAKIGGPEWVKGMLRNECQMVWVDTPRARELIKARGRNRVVTGNGVVGDFRDFGFPVALEIAKRSAMLNMALQYRKHFVVRLEGLELANGLNDPFGDLSPHVRYLLPKHLKQLYFNLTNAKLTGADQRNMEKEETRLRESFFVLQRHKAIDH